MPVRVDEQRSPQLVDLFAKSLDKRADPAGEHVEDRFYDLRSLPAILDTPSERQKVADYCSGGSYIRHLYVKTDRPVVLEPHVVLRHPGYVVADAVRFPIPGQLVNEGLKTAVLGRYALAPDDEYMLPVCIFLYEFPVGVVKKTYLVAGDHGIFSGHFFLP